MSLRLAVSVEGPTEERFVKAVLAPHLLKHGLLSIPIIIQTARSANGTKHRGGGISIRTVTDDLRRLLQGFQNGFVTSFYDFYGFADRKAGETAAQLEARIAAESGRPGNLIPYIQLHEFEALLLSDAATAAHYFQAPKIEPLLSRVVTKCGGAEEVNDGTTTAPSKRLEMWTKKHAPLSMQFTSDTKVRHGAALAERLTLPVIRNACPRFDKWVARLEMLG